MITFEDLLNVPLQSRSAEEQNSIVRRGKPVIYLEGDYEEKQRRFLLLKMAQYDWLVMLNSVKLFCWPCVLMPSHGCDVAWVQDGIPTVQLTLAAIKVHEDSDSHKESTKCLEKKRKKLAEKGLPSASNSMMVYNEDHNDDDHRIMETHLLHLGRFLKTGKSYMNDPTIGLMPFYRSWLRVYPHFKHHHQNRIGVLANRLKLNRILTASIYEVMREEIRAEVEATEYVSLILEDIGTSFHFFTTIFIRLVHPITGQLTDRFVSLLDQLKERRVEPLIEHIHHVVQEFNLADKLVAVTCGGVTVDNDQMVKLAEAMRQAYSRVMLTDVTKISRHILSRLFHTDSFTGFFALILLHMDMIMAKLRRSVSVHTDTSMDKLKSMNLSSVCTLIHAERIQMIRFLQYLYNFSERDRIDAVCCWNYLGDFASIFLTPFFAYFLKRLETLEDRIRKQFFDWSACLASIDLLETDLHKFKNEKLGIFYQQAMRKAPKASSEVVTLNVPQYNFKWSTTEFDFKNAEVKREFSELITHVIEVIISLAKQFRFDTWEKLQFFNLFNTSQLDKYVQEFPNEYLESLEAAFPDEFDSEKLKEELSYLYEECCVKKPSVEEFLQYFTCNRLASSFPETTKLAKLVHTIPCRIFAGVSQPRVTSRQYVLEQFHGSNMFLKLKPEHYFRCEWRMFRELTDSPRLRRAVVQQFFEHFESDKEDDCEDDIFDYSSDMDDFEEETYPDYFGNDDLLSTYIETLHQIGEEFYPFRNQLHYIHYRYYRGNDELDDMDFDDDYLVLLGLKKQQQTSSSDFDGYTDSEEYDADNSNSNSDDGDDNNMD